MCNNRIIFGDLNNHLISRLHSRSIFEDFLVNADNSKQVELDFASVRVVTLSFATELFSNLEYNSLKYVVINANAFVNETLQFAEHSTTGLELQD